MGTGILIMVLFGVIVGLSLKIRQNSKRIDALIEVNHLNRDIYAEEVSELFDRIESLEFVQSLFDITPDNRQLDNRQYDDDGWLFYNVHRGKYEQQRIKR